jgi:hypothetical protein
MLQCGYRLDKVCFQYTPPPDEVHNQILAGGNKGRQAADLRAANVAASA